MKRKHLLFSSLIFSCLILAANLGAAQGTPQTPEPKDTSAQAPPSGSPQSTDPNAKPSDPKPAQDSPSKKDESNTAATSNDRLFFALPNFLTLENAGQVPPMTTRQKFAVIARSSFDPVQVPWYGFLAGIAQAENSEPGYGQGAVGYGKRFGAYAADGTIENFMVGAVFPSIFRQDPRYFQSGHGSFFQRTGYSVSRIVVTRNDSGRNGFNISEIVGAGLASAISTYSYHPGRTFRRDVLENGNLVPQYWPSDRTLSNTLSVWGSQVGYDALTFVVKEFWPDIRRKIKKEHH